MEVNKNIFLILLLFLFYYLILIINIDVYSQKDFIKKSPNSFRMEKKIPKKTRKLNGVDDGDEDEELEIFRDEYDDDLYVPLNIYFDFNNFNQEIPSHLQNEEDKTKIINAMYAAKNALEKIIKIHDPRYNEEIFDHFFNDWEINSWDNSLFGDGVMEIGNSEYNYFIFFKFEDLGDENMASSKIKLTDSYGTPIIGIVTLNSRLSNSKLKSNYLEALMLHQFTHLLGFHIKTIVNTGAEFAQTYYFLGIIKSIEIEGKKKYYINYDSAPNTIKYANKYFIGKDYDDLEDSQKIKEIELEVDENDNVHWPSRLFLGEYMTKFFYLEEQVISKFTLEFLNDLQYIRIEKFYTGGLMRFGKHKLKDFIDKQCINNEGIKFENEFYYPTSNTNFDATEPSCSSGRLSKTVHKLHRYSSIPNEYIYFSFTEEHKKYGGLQIIDYCPISEFNSYDSNNIFKGRCSQQETVSEGDRIYYGEASSTKSFCALNSLIKKPSSETEYKAGCYNMFCSSKSLTIQVGEDYLVCPIKGGKIESVNYNGYILCPDYNLICTVKENKDLCNDIFDCINQEKEEKEESLVYDINDYPIIKTTQDSSTYKLESPNEEDNYELAESGGICPQYCSQCKLDRGCFKCKNDYDLLGQNEEDTTEKITCSLISRQQYYTKQINSLTIYYSCSNKMQHCVECSNGNTCTKCEDNYEVDNNNKKICKEIIQNCDEYNIDKSCKKCKTGFGLIKGKLGETSCMSITELNVLLSQKLYFTVSGEPTYYMICSEGVSNCLECEGENVCKKCIYNNEKKYGIIGDDYSTCIDLSRNEYFLDSSDGKYKLCSTQLTGCETCLINNNNKLNCISCLTNNDYTLVHGEINECKLKTDMENDNSNNYFTDDNGLNYYSCSNIQYHSVEYCLNCNNKETCLTCQNGFSLFNSNNLCISNSDLIKNKYYKINDNYYLCSDTIKGCEKCTNPNTCLECNVAYDLDENDKCIPSSITMFRYYKDPTTGKYISCEKIENCEECSSATECTKCKSGYELDDSTCKEKKENGDVQSNNGKDEDKENKNAKALSVGAIVLSAIAIVVSIVAIILVLLKNIIFKKSTKTIDITDSNNVKNEEAEEVVIQSNRRPIHNEPKTINIE